MSQESDAQEPAGFVLESFLPYRLSLLSNTISQGIAETYRKPHDLNVNEWRVVAILGRFAGLTASEIVHRGAMDKVTVSRAVKKLMDRGLVARGPTSGDRRRMPLELTRDKGIALFNEVVPMALAYEEELLGSLSKAELSRLEALMKKLQRTAEMLNQSID